IIVSSTARAISDAARSAIRMNPEPNMTLSAPEVTVVLNVHEDAAHLVAALPALPAQEGAPSFEVLVRVTSSPVGARVTTRPLGDPYAVAVRIVEEPTREAWRLRNRAIDECQTQWIAFLADDAVPERSWLASLSRPTRTDRDSLAASNSMYNTALFDCGLRFEPWS